MRSGTPRQAAEAGVRAAVRALAAGRMVVVADDREREDEGDLVAAAALMSAEQMAFFLRHGSGIVCGINLHGKDLEQAMEKAVGVKAARSQPTENRP